MLVKKYVQTSHLIGSALTRVNPQNDPVLWDILQALKSLVAELQENTSQIESRLAQLEAAAQKKE